MSNVTLSSILGQPRRRRVTILASDPAVQIPDWAQGGKGVVIVTGCGAGGSGAIATVNRGAGGSSAGMVTSIELMIPAGVTTIAATIAATTPGITGNTAQVGTDGGSTTMIMGAIRLNLMGGPGGGGPFNNPLTLAFISDSVDGVNRGSTTVLGTVGGTSPAITGVAGRFMAGVLGGAGNNLPGGFGAGGASLFGGFGAGLAAAPVSTTNGGNASGFGAGGAGAYSTLGQPATSGSGAPGFLSLVFEEGF